MSDWTSGPVPSQEAVIARLKQSNDILRKELFSDRKRAQRAFWRGACFGAVLAVGAFVASAAIGQPFQEPRMSLEGPTGDCFAVVAIENRAGVYNLAETLMTAAGPVTLQYRTVGGHNATDADEVTVIALPDGVVADPERMALPDGETGHVCLIEWVGL